MLPLARASIIGLYISKDNLAISHFSADTSTIICGQHSAITYFTPQKLRSIVNQNLKPDIILTNNEKHPILYDLREQSQVVCIHERGLEDEVIANNLGLLRVNAAGTAISSKASYIKLMSEQSGRCSLGKEKFKALGMLIYYLLNEGNHSVVSTIYLNDIEYFSDQIFNTVQVTNSECEALEITKQEVHPSLIKGKGRSKEGFSVYNLFETAMVSAGSKKLLRNYFKNPTFEISQLEQRLCCQHWMKECVSDHQSLKKIFRGMHNLESILTKFQESKVQCEDWRKLARTIESMIILFKILSERAKASAAKNQPLPRIISEFVEGVEWNQIGNVLSIMSSTIDLSSYGIKRGVDPTLDNLKKVYDNMPHLLTVYAQRQNWSQDLRIVFMAQVGYLIRVPHQVEEAELGDEDWTLQFVKNSGRFYCNELTKMLDEEYGDVYGEITDREKKIFLDLESMVVESSAVLEECYWRTCLIECWAGISEVTVGMSRPKYSSEGLIISGGWHLLLGQDAIDNNSFSFNHSKGPIHKVFNSEQNLVNTNYTNRVTVISGPNGSGKTVYMKQTALIIYLAHLGFYVPAQLAEVPLIDKIVIVEAERSIYHQACGIEAQMASLGRLTAPGLITNKSLVLIDQLGSSMDLEIAQKILTATILFLSDNKKGHISQNAHIARLALAHRREETKFTVPLSMVVTHLTDLMSSRLIEEGELIRFLTMEMEKEEISLYKVKPGVAKKGYGIESAKQYVSEEVVKRATLHWQRLVEERSRRNRA